MKKLVLLFTALILGTAGTQASTTEGKVATSNAYNNNNAFIFVEQGITFAVYPDGEFDFYIENYVSGRKNGVTMNSGYDYSPYAQYDDYGAVIQVENVPIYYDYYGRVTQIGDVDIRYRNNRVQRVGGMYVYYNRNGFYDYHVGYINVYNRHYVYRPFHRFFLRPAIGFSLVFNSPYRRYYRPFRYTYYKPYRFNTRRAYAKVGREHRYNQVRRDRATIYRNDRRVAQRMNNPKTKNNAVRSNRTVTRNNKGVYKTSNNNRGAVQTKSVRSTNTRAVRNTNTRAIADRAITQRTTTTRSPQRNTVTKRTVTQTPRRTTVSRSTTTYKKPVSRTSNKNVRSTTTRTQRTVAKRPSTRSSSKATVKRSTSSRKDVASRSNSRSNTRRY